MKKTFDCEFSDQAEVNLNFRKMGQSKAIGQAMWWNRESIAPPMNPLVRIIKPASNGDISSKN